MKRSEKIHSGDKFISNRLVRIRDGFKKRIKSDFVLKIKLKMKTQLIIKTDRNNKLNTIKKKQEKWKP